MKKMLMVFVLFAVCVVTAENGKKIGEKSFLNEKPELSKVINTDTLRVIRKTGETVSVLVFDKAITENAGTAKEKKCLCQAVAFRIAQLCASVWSDNVFRSYEVKKIRTGWNTDGPYEFFSDKTFDNESGDLQIKTSKIVVENKDGSKAASAKELKGDDAWYEVTFNNGIILDFVVKTGEKGVYTDEFLKKRSRIKKGEESIGKEYMKERKAIQKRLEKLPFERIVVKQADKK